MLINIAIDGPSASGKSTIAKALAKRLGYKHLDTGAMYRGCAYLAKHNDLDLTDSSELVAHVKKASFKFDDHGHLLLNGQDISQEIRHKDIDLLTSTISQFADLRKLMVSLQQEIAKDKGYILDGRDIGSVVLPDAELKIFQTASLESRAKRRYLEYQSKGQSITYPNVLEELKQRDEQDTQRLASPLVKMEDAYELDTSAMSIEEVVDWIMNKVSKLSQKENI